MTEFPLAIRERDVCALLDLRSAINALEAAFLDEARGEFVSLDKTVAQFGGHSTLHALGAASALSQLAGTKTWAHTPGGADPHLLLFDATNGRLVALIEAFALGQFRTAASAAVATARLAVRTATTMGVIGSGRQALAQVAAVTAVRPISEVRVYSPTPANRASFARRVSEELGILCEAVDSVGDAVCDADVVTLITRATSPFLTSELVPSGAHVNAVGAITPERAEFSPELLGRCAVITSDDVGQCQRLSSELRSHFGGSGRPWSDLHRVADLVAGDIDRPAGADLTLYKGMGSGIEDVALGSLVLARARESGVGHVLPRDEGQRPDPNLSNGFTQGRAL